MYYKICIVFIFKVRTILLNFFYLIVECLIITHVGRKSVKKKKKAHGIQNCLISFQNIKGIVHPKMKTMLLITHPHVVPNL